MADPKDGHPVRILHLSDIHMRAKTASDANPVLRDLTDFLVKEVAAGMVPDLVAITGDLAHSGKAGEYTRARKWLDDLWPKLGGLPPDRLLLVPGNHDVDHSAIDFSVEAVQDKLLQGRKQDLIAAVLSDKGQRKPILKRYTAYQSFAKKWFGVAQTVPWWQRSIEVGGSVIHLAGLDSAWMSWDGKDRNRLLIGRWQVNETVLAPQSGTPHWRITLLHHPWDYLAEFEHEEIPSTIRRHADLVLRGHRHKTDPEHIAGPDRGRTCLELAAGCVYAGRDYPNAYQWIELSPPPDKKVRVHFRRWDEGRWIVDRHRTDDGADWWGIDLGAPAPKPGAKPRPSAPTVPPEYQDWVRRRWETVELLGVKEGRAVTLTQVYVPAVTRPPADLEAAAKAERQRRRGLLAEHEPQLIPMLQRLDQESLYVPAPAGAGKSTFCQWVALQSIAEDDLAHPVPAPKGFAEPVPTALRGRLPVLVPLRDFSLEMDCGRGGRAWTRATLDQALADWIDRSRPGGLTGTLLQEHLAAGSALLLLDGLDEVAVTETRDDVTVYPRTLLLSGLVDALPVWLKAGNRVLLTSRPYGLDRDGVHRLGLPEVGLEPVPEDLQHLFVRRWFHTLQKPEKIDDLIATIDGRHDELAPLVDNPLLLTAICVLYDNGGRLPEERYALYKDIVGNVLHNRYSGDAKVRDPVERRLEAIALGMHLGDEHAPRQTPAAEISWDEVERLLARFAELNFEYEAALLVASMRREELLNRSGLLVPRPHERAAFYHLSIQEFLAAQRLARSGDDVNQVFQKWRGVPEWRLTLWFLFAAQMDRCDTGWGLRLLDRLIQDQDRAAVKANPAPAVLLAEALDLCLHKSYPVPPALEDAFTRLALDAIEDEVEVTARQALGLTLGRLGDQRIKSLNDPEAYVEVPAGPYPYGENKEETVEIPAPFGIGRYPVTNQQYREFIVDGGYDPSNKNRWWSKDGLAWLRERRASEPAYWHDRRRNAPNQPVVGVSFWEAEACAAWARGRLPTEQEWDAAARGPNGLTYPWGDDWQDGICNTEESGLGGISAVGLFPRARQAALGIEDLAGNVLEWCDRVSNSSNDEVQPAPVLRGGSLLNHRHTAHVAIRLDIGPSARSPFAGFRVVRSSPS